MRIAIALGASLGLTLGVACASNTGAGTAVNGTAAGSGGAAPMTTAASAAGASGAAGGAAGAPASPPADYSVLDNWLCRPGRSDACASDLSTTVVAADGTLTPEPFVPNAAPPIDCFYVYPTISNDTTPNSDLVPGQEERDVVIAQFARFGSQCRLFAPMYRQVTLASLRAAVAGMPVTVDRALGYNDVSAAWKHYMENDNQGRGVVLVGHSQGAGVLTQLIREQLDKQPLDSRLISALLIGTTVSVPKGADVGGTFMNMPFCRANDQLGCVISYASFRTTAPPPANSRFAQATDPNLVGGCSNPAALSGGPAPLHAYLNAKGSGLTTAAPAPWTMASPTVPTPFVSVPGLLTAQCVDGERGSYLSITINADPADPRTDDITGDVLAAGMVQADWGLHVVDMHLAMGDLVTQVQAKAAAYAARTGGAAATTPTPTP
jgi:hypothetical protein